MDSIYFTDPLGLLIELASYRFEPPFGFTHSDVLLEAHRLRVARGDYNIGMEHLADAIEAMVLRSRDSLSDDRSPKDPYRRSVQSDRLGECMAAHKLHVLKPSVNNLTARIFVRAAGLDFEEEDVWGKTSTPEFLAKNPAHLTPMLEEEGLPRRRSGRAARSCSTSATSTGSTSSIRPIPAQRAMVDSAMFYLIGTFYPLVTRATYPALSFPQYPGEVGTSPARRRHEGAGAEGRRGRAGRAARRVPRVLPRRQAVHRRRLAVDRRHPPGGDARVPRGHRLRPAAVGARLHGGHGVVARRRVLPSRSPTSAGTSPT